MTHRFLSASSALKAVGSLVILGGFASLGLVGCPQGGIGDPCIPEDEYRGNFAGFKITEENIESRSFQCETRICLVNHFQGRVSCPAGQPEPTPCTDNESACTGDDTCEVAGSIIADCDPTPCGDDGADPNNCNNPDGTNSACNGRVCDEAGRYCHCGAGDCPSGYSCDTDESNQCITKVCSKPQSALEEGEQRCYVPGTNEPVAVPVCAQCAPASKRTATGTSPDAVYCSCRCGVAEGESEDENFNFCECPDGFECQEIRKNVGLGDEQITGKYCVRSGTSYKSGDEVNCGVVQGYWGPQCFGQAPGGGTTEPEGS
jgi:hypothetical protein